MIICSAARATTTSMGGGADRLIGGPGKDKLVGGRDRDNISGGAANDTLSARDRGRDVRLWRGKDSVVADEADRLRGCERIMARPR
jgi:Ca2+-binding RTX toxin-like protein